MPDGVVDYTIYCSTTRRGSGDGRQRRREGVLAWRNGALAGAAATGYAAGEGSRQGGRHGREGRGQRMYETMNGVPETRPFVTQIGRAACRERGCRYV